MTRRLNSAASIHSFSSSRFRPCFSKASAVALGAALFPFLGWGVVLPLQAAIVLLVASQVEEAAITRVLPAWASDVPTIRHARNLAAAPRSAPPPEAPEARATRRQTGDESV